jgi:hypothetical protein
LRCKQADEKVVGAKGEGKRDKGEFIKFGGFPFCLLPSPLAASLFQQSAKSSYAASRLKGATNCRKKPRGTLPPTRP